MKRSASRDIAFFSDGFEDCEFYVSEEERVLSPRPKRGLVRKTPDWYDLSMFNELVFSTADLSRDLLQYAPEGHGHHDLI